MRNTCPSLGFALLTLALAAPVAAGDFSSYSGADLYGRFCASCHGGGLRGDGPVAKSLVVAVPDLTRIAARHGGHFPDNWVFRVIDGREAMLAHGPREMPVWGMELWREHGADVTAAETTRDLIGRLVAYLKAHQAVPALAEPGH